MDVRKVAKRVPKSIWFCLVAIPVKAAFSRELPAFICLMREGHPKWTPPQLDVVKRSARDEENISELDLSVPSDQYYRSAAGLCGNSLDYAIELLSFAATDYSKADLKPSAEQFALLSDLVSHGFLAGEFVRNASGEVTGLLAGQITQEGIKFLAELNATKNGTLPRTSVFTVIRRLALQFIHSGISS